ncbi:MAG: hypothetical protein K0Q93_155 [Nocardioidaceae bacterium]|jgi:hypothetical protein|nr:hypothetical protein [Nocardioidaceae bacterium]
MDRSDLSSSGRLLVTVCTATLLTLYAGTSTASPSSGQAAAVLVLLVGLLALPVFLLGRRTAVGSAGGQSRGRRHVLAVLLAMSALVLANGSYSLLDGHRSLALVATFVVSAVATSALLALDHRITSWASSL